MKLLAQYDRALAALGEALKATRVDQVLASRDELEHVKLHARQIQDRALLADATEFQMRVERRLGVLLQEARDAGFLQDKVGPPRRLVAAGELPPATLKQIGVDKPLALKAQASARMLPDDFEAAVAGMRSKMAAGKSIVVDPVDQAGKFAQAQQRRDDHAARTMNGGTVEDLGKLALSGYRAKSISSDPQWKFLTRSPLGDGRSANVHYKTEEVDRIKNLPVGELLDDNAAFYMWVVDWCPQDALDLLAHYGLRHVTTAFTWVKQNSSGEGWHMGQGFWTRANPEDCWLATKGSPKRLYADVRQLIIAPVMEHSRKPDEALERIERLTEGPYLELQARRTRPGWLSWGDELKFTGVAA